MAKSLNGLHSPRSKEFAPNVDSPGGDFAHLASRINTGVLEQNHALDAATQETTAMAVSLKETADQAQSLARSSEDTVSAINEIAASIEQVNGNTAEVATAATQTATAIKQIAGSSKAVSETAQEMARRVVRDPCLQPRDEVRAAVFHDELAELPAARGDGPSPMGVSRVVPEELGVLMDQHVGARSRWHHDRSIGRRQHVERMPGHLPGVGVETGVVRGLAAAGEADGHGHLEPQPLEHADDRHAHVRADLVHEAGVEEMDHVAFRFPLSAFGFQLSERPQQANPMSSLGQRIANSG